MPPTPEPAALLDACVGLPLRVEDASCTVRDVDVPSYPGGRRPSAEVVLRGNGAQGHGEHVAWTEAEHLDLASRLADVVPRGSWRLGGWAKETARRTSAPHARAALEAAALDLALRQQGASLFALLGVTPPAVRYVVSFDRRADPAAEARRLLAAAPGMEFKIDADLAWTDAVYAELAALDAVAVLDFKGAGVAADHARAQHALPRALLEDPGCDVDAWRAVATGRLSLDDAIRAAADVVTLPVRPAAVNVKPARMGGVIAALAAVVACARRGVAVYFGGMFEVGVGRRQLHVLAALCAPDGPNDVAPIAVGDATPVRPPRLVVDGRTPGFGAA